MVQSNFNLNMSPKLPMEKVSTMQEDMENFERDVKTTKKRRNATYDKSPI